MTASAVLKWTGTPSIGWGPTPLDGDCLSARSCAPQVPLNKLTQELNGCRCMPQFRFQLADSDTAENDLMEVEVMSFEQCYTELLSKLTVKVVVEQSKHKVLHVSPQGQCIGFFNNKLGEKYPVCTCAVSALLSMPVTARAVNYAADMPI
jgi:hypothetical protein